MYYIDGPAEGILAGFIIYHYTGISLYIIIYHYPAEGGFPKCKPHKNMCPP